MTNNIFLNVSSDADSETILRFLILCYFKIHSLFWTLRRLFTSIWFVAQSIWLFDYTPVRMAAIQKSTSNKCWRGCGEKGTLLYYWWECKLVQPLWKTVWRSLKKLEIELPYDPAIPLLGIHTKDTRSESDTCTPMFIAALFVIASTWKQPRCPSADEWTRKLWYIYTMEYYSAVKKNSLESVLMRWMKLEPIIQSEVSQKDKDHYNILTHIYGI